MLAFLRASGARQTDEQNGKNGNQEFLLHDRPSSQPSPG
jgi:hypothetical protein